jgi:hypothetical protein
VFENFVARVDSCGLVQASPGLWTFFGLCGLARTSAAQNGSVGLSCLLPWRTSLGFVILYALDNDAKAINPRISLTNSQRLVHPNISQ